MTFGGNCISKINGKMVFIPYSIPGEELKVEIIDSKRDYDTAKIHEIIKPSPYRVKPACVFYEKCGGCNMMHIDSEYQKELRVQMLKDSFERNGVVIPEIQVVSGSPLNYRSRFQLNNGGLSEKSSNNIVNVSECCVAEPEINKWLNTVPMEKRPSGRCHLFGSSKVVDIGGNTSAKISVSVEEQKNVQDFAALKKKNKNVKQIKKRYSGTTINPQDVVKVNILGHDISFNTKGFFQSNMEVLEKAIKEVCNGLVGTSVLDMYAGCGTFSVFLSDFFEKVTLVEHNRDALVFAEQNLSEKNHESYGLSGAKFVEYNGNSQWDAVIIDPPRSGMEKEVCQWLCKSGIPQIRSVSCDPATHARDIYYLVKAGYKLEKLFLLDFYPNTSHIESLAVLTKDKN